MKSKLSTQGDNRLIKSSHKKCHVQLPSRSY